MQGHCLITAHNRITCYICNWLLQVRLQWTVSTEGPKLSDDLVYSTTSGKAKKQKKSKTSHDFVASGGPAKMRLESKGRAGKTVTVLFELPLEPKDAKKHMKNMQALFGCGATLKGGTIELRGDLCSKVAEYFEKNGLKIIRAGG